MGRWSRGSKHREDGAVKAGEHLSLTPLQLVTSCEPEAMLEQLRAGVDGLDWLGADGWGALHHAASLGLRGHIEALLDAKANALLKTAAPAGSFAKGITALQVAESVHKAGRGDRAQVIEVLRLGVQANGWGNWRTLKTSDGHRQASMASSGTLPASSPRPNPVASAAGAQATISAARLEEAVAAAEDRVRWAMRNELAARESATRLVEMQLLEAQQRESGCMHRVRLMEEQLDAMSARERDAKGAAAAAKAAKDAAQKAAETAETRATEETVARRQAVAIASEAQTQAETASTRAEAAEAESKRMATAMELAEKAQANAEVARAAAEAAAAAAEAALAEAQLTAQRQAEQLKAMALASDGSLEQMSAQVAQLQDRCQALAADLEAAGAARVAVEMENARLETSMQEQTAAAVAAAKTAATEAAKTLQQEVDLRLAAEQLCLKRTQELEFERARAAEQLERSRAAQAAQKAAALRSRRGTAGRALAKMVHRGLGRAFGGWLAAVQRLQRHRALLQRTVGRFAHGAIARAFSSWLTWLDSSREERNALDQLAKREKDLRAMKAARAALDAQVAQLKTELANTNARHDATLARIEAEAQQERKTLRAAVRKRPVSPISRMSSLDPVASSERQG